MPEEVFDETDAAIVEQLSASPRMAFREIGRRLGVSEATIRARVKRLQDSNVLRSVAFLDPAGFGRLVLGVALVDVDPPAHEDVVRTLSHWPEVVYLSTLIGAHTGVQAQVEATVHKLAYTAPRGLRPASP